MQGATLAKRHIKHSLAIAQPNLSLPPDTIYHGIIFGG